MIADLLRGVPSVEVVSEASDPDSGSTKVVLRVLEERGWMRLMPKLLRTASTDFGIEVHKVFQLQEVGDKTEVRYAWMILCWGEMSAEVQRRLASACATPKPPVAAMGSVPRAGKPAVPAPARVAPAPRPPSPSPVTAKGAVQHDDDADEAPLVTVHKEAGVHHLEKTELRNGGTETTVPLAHVSSERFSAVPSAHDTVTLHQPRRFKAFVQERGEAEFTYARTL